MELRFFQSNVRLLKIISREMEAFFIQKYIIKEAEAFVWRCEAFIKTTRLLKKHFQRSVGFV
jgi:hypothetical protein